MKKSLLVLISIIGLGLLNGCGSSGPPPPPIGVNLAPSTNQALDVNQSVPLTANVVNDTSNQGVNWTVICPAGVATCGAMAQAKSASGAADNFVAPANVNAAETVTVTATSVSDPTQAKSVQVTVNPAFALVNPAPTQPLPGNVGTPFSFNLMSFVQGGTPPFNWVVKSGTLPTWLTLNPSTGMVTGTPSAKASAAAVSFNCTDSGIPPVSTPASIQISLEVNPGILVISPSGLPGGTLRTQYSGSTAGSSLTGSGGLTPYKWTWAAAAGSSLPPGLSFSSNADNTASIAGVLTGVPTTYNVVVTMTDSESPATTPAIANYTITVNAPPPLVISSAPPPTGRVGAQYNQHVVRYCVRWIFNQCQQWGYRTAWGFQVTATGGVGAHTWAWAAVAPSPLPPGLTLAANGMLSGTPPIDPKTANTYPVSVTVTDSGIPPVQTTTPYSIIIQNPPIPVINMTPTPPAGAVNLPYSFTFTASQGLPSLTLTWSETGTLIPGLGAVSSAGVLSGTPTATGTFPITVDVQDSLLQNAIPQNFDIQIFPHGFKATGSMATARDYHTATLLSAGKVLITGGRDSSASPLAAAELFDPASGSFAPTGSMVGVRDSHTATLLSTGKVLVIGGRGVNDVALATAELYDPAAGTFTATGSMANARAFHTATVLSDGRVLVTGGVDATGKLVAIAELFDPTKGSFTSTGTMTTARYNHTATLISGGKVLLAGGVDANANPLATAELFDPVAGSFTATGTMGTARSSHTATLLNTGKVFVVGGLMTANAAVPTAELFDPTTGNFTAAAGSMATARAFHTATLLSDGTVLVTGGVSASGGSPEQSAEVFDPVSTTFALTGSMGAARELHTATLLKDGKEVLVIGGIGSNTTRLATAELYQ
jgi:hypothetical protein